MIQFNLLPDVKLEYIKAQRMRRLIVSISILVSALALVVLIVMVGTNQLGKKHLKDLSRDITSESNKLQNEPDINGILTVQNQLESLSALHGAKPAVSRLFGYLNSLTPAQVSITSYASDFAAYTVTINGTADALSTVNQYVDTLKFTTYSVKDDTSDTKKSAFSNVVLSSFGLSNSGDTQAKSASYTISFSYDPVIFDITKTVSLSIPNLISTRSQVSQPTDLFTASPSPAASPAATPKPTGGTQ